MKIYESAAELVGRTPLVRLNNIAKKYGLKAEICAKVESFNPYSVKDRVAVEIIAQAEKDGKLKGCLTPEDRERVMEFLRKMSSLLSQIATKIVSPFLMNFQVLCNRFATAKFEVDPLLDDFKQVLEGVWANLKYPDSINHLMKEQFMALLDATLLNKLIANPARFMFSNAVVWNSFITAFETVEKHPLDSLRQSVCAMVMAKNLTTPESSQEIIVTLCPDLDKKLLVYFMKNYRPDEMMPDPIDYERFREMMAVDDVISYGTVKPREVTSFSSAGEKLNYMEWNNVVITAPVSRAFPYFIAYVKGNE